MSARADPRGGAISDGRPYRDRRQHQSRNDRPEEHHREHEYPAEFWNRLMYQEMWSGYRQSAEP
jgi:hypothetical protein